MKIWIVHDSKGGNGKKVAQILESYLSETNETEIINVNDFKYYEVLRNEGDCLILGTPIRIGNASMTVRTWQRKLIKIAKERERPIPKVMVFVTQCMEGAFGENLRLLFENSDAAKEVYPKIIRVRLADVKGPITGESMEMLESIGPEVKKFFS